MRNLGSSNKRIIGDFIFKSSRESFHRTVFNKVSTAWDIQSMSAVNEHITSTLFRLLGVPCQRTHLIQVNDAFQVGIQRFKAPTETSYIYSFGAEEDTSTQLLEARGVRVRNYSNKWGSDALKMLQIIDAPESDVKLLFDMFTVDVIVGNPDRHQRNWGGMV